MSAFYMYLYSVAYRAKRFKMSMGGVRGRQTVADDAAPLRRDGVKPGAEDRRCAAGGRGSPSCAVATASALDAAVARCASPLFPLLPGLAPVRLAGCRCV